MAPRDDQARALDGLVAAVRASRCTTDAVVRRDLMQVVRALEAIVGATVTKRVAARQLDVSVQSLDAWIRVGSIVPVHGSSTRAELDRRDVVELALQCEVIRAAGRRRGVLASAIEGVVGVRQDQQAIIDAIELARFQTTLVAS